MTFKNISILRTLVRMSPWFWVSLIYGAQTLGAFIVSRWFKVSSGDTWIPISLLAFGAVAASCFGLRDRSRSMSQWLCWFPLALYAAFIFSLSSRSFTGAELSFKADYFHLVEFATLALFLSCLWTPLLLRGKVFAFAGCVIASGLLFGFTDELHQAFIPGRDPSLLDLLYDAVGLSIGCAIFLGGNWLHRCLSAGLPEFVPEPPGTELDACSGPT